MPVIGKRCVRASSIVSPTRLSNLSAKLSETTTPFCRTAFAQRLARGARRDHRQVAARAATSNSPLPTAMIVSP